MTPIERELKRMQNELNELAKRHQQQKARIVQLENALIVAHHNHPNDEELERLCQLLLNDDFIQPDEITFAKAKLIPDQQFEKN